MKKKIMVCIVLTFTLLLGNITKVVATSNKS